MFNRLKNIAKLNEPELIILAKKDTKYFGELYNRYFDKIFIFVFQKVGGHEDLAGDITQSVFIKAMANLHKYEDRGFPFGSWLYRIAQNETNLFFRKNKKEISVAVSEQVMINLVDEITPESTMSGEQQEKLINILNDLKESEIQIIELRFFQEMSFKAIAEILEITEANAKMKTYRILGRLQKKWTNK